MKTDHDSATSKEVGAPAREETEVTPEMIEAGEDVILREVGGYDLGGLFSAPDLAVAVFLAMSRVAPAKKCGLP